MHIRRGMGAKSKSVRWKKTGHIGPLHTLHRRVIQKPNLLDGKNAACMPRALHQGNVLGCITFPAVRTVHKQCAHTAHIAQILILWLLHKLSATSPFCVYLFLQASEFKFNETNLNINIMCVVCFTNKILFQQLGVRTNAVDVIQEV